MKQKILDVIDQFEEGAITARELINYTLTVIEDADPEGYKDWVKAVEKSYGVV